MCEKCARAYLRTCVLKDAKHNQINLNLINLLQVFLHILLFHMFFFKLEIRKKRATVLYNDMRNSRGTFEINTSTGFMACDTFGWKCYTFPIWLN